MHSLLFLEFIGTSELLVVLVVALIIFGPRKLPELGRSLGQALHQIRSATEDFKQTWETEARLDTTAREALAPAAPAELAEATEAHQELVPVDTEVTAAEVVETHTPAHDAPSVPYVNHEAAYGEV